MMNKESLGRGQRQRLKGAKRPAAAIAHIRLKRNTSLSFASPPRWAMRLPQGDHCSVKLCDDGYHLFAPALDKLTTP